jgi:hypothetical protein
MEGPSQQFVAMGRRVPKDIVRVDASDKPPGTGDLQPVPVKLHHHSLALEIVSVGHGVKDRLPGHLPGKVGKLQLPEPLFLNGANAVVNGYQLLHLPQHSQERTLEVPALVVAGALPVPEKSNLVLGYMLLQSLSPPQEEKSRQGDAMLRYQTQGFQQRAIPQPGQVGALGLPADNLAEFGHLFGIQIIFADTGHDLLGGVHLASPGQHLGHEAAGEGLAILADADLCHPIAGGVGWQATGHMHQEERAFGLREFFDLYQDVGVGAAIYCPLESEEVIAAHPLDGLPAGSHPVPNTQDNGAPPSISQTHHCFPEETMQGLEVALPGLKLEALVFQSIGRLAFQTLQQGTDFFFRSHDHKIPGEMGSVNNKTIN